MDIWVAAILFGACAIFAVLIAQSLKQRRKARERRQRILNRYRE